MRKCIISFEYDQLNREVIVCRSFNAAKKEASKRKKVPYRLYDTRGQFLKAVGKPA